MADLKQLRIDLLGDHDYPLGRARIPEALLYNYADLARRMREQDPRWTEELILRYVWAKGLGVLQRTINHGVLPDPMRTPEPGYRHEH